jgi:hypothetical protein
VNRWELKQALDEAGIRPNSYVIEDVTEGRHWPDQGGLALHRDGDRWVVFTGERGQYYDHLYFPTEEEACRYFYAEERVGELLNTPRSQLSPEQLEEMGRLLEESRAVRARASS